MKLFIYYFYYVKKEYNFYDILKMFLKFSKKQISKFIL